MGKTVVLVTHDISIIERYCDRAMLLREGKIEKIGSPKEVAYLYMFQNMTDEEKERVLEVKEKEKKSLTKKKNEPSEEDKKTPGEEEIEVEKVAQVLDVEFLDSSGKPKFIFKSGEPMTAVVKFKFNKPQDNANFSFSIFDERENYVIGVNTIFDKIETAKYIKNREFKVAFKSLPLNTGTYHARVFIVRENWRAPFDVLMKSKTFKIISNAKHEGVAALSYEWL